LNKLMVSVLLTILLGAIFAGLACAGAAQRSAAANPAKTGAASVPAESNGKLIYTTSKSSSGQTIVSQGFSVMNWQIACTNCHGQDGKGGGIQLIMQSINVPNITAPVLNAPQPVRPTYTDEALRITIRQGEAFPGSWAMAMPRCQVSDGDTNDLIAFLHTLK
jgi:hypothetical protein